MRPLNPLKVLARQVMIVLVIPPLIFRADGRGLHDMVAGTATVTMPTFRELTGNASLSAHLPRICERMPFMLVGTGPFGIGTLGRAASSARSRARTSVISAGLT